MFSRPSLVCSSITFRIDSLVQYITYPYQEICSYSEYNPVNKDYLLSALFVSVPRHLRHYHPSRHGTQKEIIISCWAYISACLVDHVRFLVFNPQLFNVIALTSTRTSFLFCLFLFFSLLLQLKSDHEENNMTWLFFKGRVT